MKLGMLSVAVLLIVLPAFGAGYIAGTLNPSDVDYSHSGWTLIALALTFSITGGAWIIGNFHRMR